PGAGGFRIPGGTQVKICLHCERPFERNRFGPAPKYCSTRCRSAAAHLRAKRDGRYEQWKRRAVERAATERAQNAKPCPYCGDLMLNPKRVQCGKPDCKRQYDAARMREFLATPEGRAYRALSRARRRAAEIEGEDFDPVEIFERDGWRCGVCKRRVGRTLEHPHPRSASLDHIVPIVDGGEHVRSNVQCAHLECNLRKRHLGPGQLMLVG
ncbi:MAG: HNH endonuclease, partial [Gammaproteobacteria bacterium]|nr:HNH endonuclease [Gammaproteobacteria bacterium]